MRMAPGVEVRTDGDCEQPSHGFSAPVHRTQALDPESISVLNWNIYKGTKTGWARDFRRYTGQADIVLLQEAPLGSELRQLLAGAHRFWGMNSAFSYNGVECGVLMASTVPPLKSCGLRHPEPLISLPKTALITRYALNGSADELVVANVHGINFTLGTAAYRRQLTGLANVLRSHSGPMIVAGDFNDWSKGRTAALKALMEDLGLSPVPFALSQRTTFFNRPIDHMYYRGLELLAATVHPVDSSDHNPLFASFRLTMVEAEYLSSAAMQEGK